MENNEFKKVPVKNRTCSYFNDIIKLDEFDFDNIFIGEKSHENTLIYDISYKTLIDPKPLCIRFDKIDGFTKIRIRSKNWHHIYFFHYFAKIKVDSYDSLPIEKNIDFT